MKPTFTTPVCLRAASLVLICVFLLTTGGCAGEPAAPETPPSAITENTLETPPSAVSESAPETFLPYKPYGLSYDAAFGRLLYQGQTVRCFEDSYPLDGQNICSAVSFFDEDGVIDVMAVRDLSQIARNSDGSYDPGGKLTGLRVLSGEEFAGRDLEPFKNPPAQITAVAIEGDVWDPREMERIAQEYAAFGVTYDSAKEQWYYNGVKVRQLRDILTSNGENPSGGNFKGSLRLLHSDEGQLDIETIRDFKTPDANGYGTLTGIQVCSPESFREHSDGGTMAETP